MAAPRKQEADRRVHQLQIRLTAAELRELETAARATGYPVAAYVRAAALRAMRADAAQATRGT